MAETPPDFFTLEEANRVVQAIKPRVRAMVEASEEILSLQPALRPMLEKANLNGGSLSAGKLIGTYARLRAALEDIQSTGALVKDLRQGLLDFPSRRGDRTIYLCWKYQEEEILYWHERDSGFAGRQAL